MSILRVCGLHAGYGSVDVVHDVSLDVGVGEIVVVLGANGAGKTTTMRALAGLIPRRGEVLLADAAVQRAAPDRIVRLGLALVPQGRGTFAELSVEDNLRCGAFTRRDHAGVTQDLERWYSVFPRLGERRSQRAGSLSGGEQQMLAIARALMSRPRLLVCDEPSLGLAPLVTKELFEVLRQLNLEEGLSVLLVEQNANLALRIAHRGYVLEHGRLVRSGPATELAADDSVRQAYLGY